MMNKIIKKIILCCILGIYILNIPIPVFAGIYMFSNLTVSDGLTQGTINVVYQDSEGYIWIGTQDGLNRYNGYDFKEFNKSVNKKNSLVSGYIMSITEDKKGNLWVGTIDGISKIDLQH